MSLTLLAPDVGGEKTSGSGGGRVEGPEEGSLPLLSDEAGDLGLVVQTLLPGK